MKPDFLLCWSIFASIASAVARPQVESPDDSDDDLVTVIYNDAQRTYIPVANVFPYYRTAYVPPATDIRNARIVGGPLEIRCFFSSPSESFRRSRSENPFVSETFMASDDAGLRTPFPAAHYLTCFRLPARPEGAKMIAIWFETSSLPPEESGAPHTELNFIDLEQDDDYGSIAAQEYEPQITVDAAAIVYGSGPAPACFLLSDRERIQNSYFTIGSPRLRPVRDTYQIVAVEDLERAIRYLNG